MPEVIQHKGASLAALHLPLWLTTEGVYGVALGVSVQFIFLFVLFGTLLDLAGAGNYMLQVSLALLGHLRGGPAKVAVVSSALNGVVSGSSVSNVVSGGIFTIPLMKRTGYGGVKAGAIEAASSINGQIMPPVMGAAAFLMVEYVGIPYTEIVKHAILPALISYVALFYIVHLEALKYDLQPIPRGYAPPWREQLIGLGHRASPARSSRWAWSTASSSARVRFRFGGAAGLLGSRCARSTSCCSRYSSRYPDLPYDDPRRAIHLPRAVADGARRAAFLHPDRRAALVPDGRGAVAGLVGLLGDGDAMVLVVVQPALLALFAASRQVAVGVRQGFADLWKGLVPRRAQHDRHRRGLRQRRPDRRRHHADRHGTDDDRLRRAGLRRATCW